MSVSFEFSPETDRFAALPQSLRRVARLARVGPTAAPVLLAHPDWETTAPVALWLHGRSVFKELDPGRYSRWVKAGLAVCAIDLPGHGERSDGRGLDPANSLSLIAEGVAEIDGIVSALAEHGGGVFDTTRLALGGLSMGGMITLRRLCDEHAFAAALVEATTGDLAGLYSGRYGSGWPAAHEPAAIAEVDPGAHLAGFRPIPLLALHSEADWIVPWACQAAFLERLKAHYANWQMATGQMANEESGDAAALIRVMTWPQTGAPEEHVGFGKFANDAKNAGAAFLAEGLGVAE